MERASLRSTDTGQVVDGQGWFIINAGEASWERMPDMGAWCGFEAADARFERFGVSVNVLQPGESPGLYHAEDAQEGFLVLAGECVALVEGAEHRMRQWDYLHCPPGTLHITIGAGDGPCALLMIGAPRSASLDEIHYPADALAACHGVAARRTTGSSQEAYAGRDRTVTRQRAPWPPV
jgi:uncharacterized cupin superfamily protein